MRRSALILLSVVVLSSTGHAQVVVTDPANTIRNALTAVLKEYLLDLQISQHSQLRRMAQRLSMFTHLGKYSAPDAPRWRRHPEDDGESEMFSSRLQSALDFGDVDGTGYRSVVHGVIVDSAAMAAVPGGARSTIERQLSTIDLTDAISVATIHNSGRLRFAGRAELRAIEALDADVTDGSLEQSATAVLDKISGAQLRPLLAPRVDWRSPCTVSRRLAEFVALEREASIAHFECCIIASWRGAIARRDETLGNAELSRHAGLPAGCQARTGRVAVV